MKATDLQEETFDTLNHLRNILVLALAEEEDSDDRVRLSIDLRVGDGQRICDALAEVLFGEVSQ